MSIAMGMRTLIVSDLHLGNGGDYDVFAGAVALPALLDHLAAEPTRVIVNGDSIDFLMNEDPLVLAPASAADQARAIVAAAASAAVLQAFGRVLARGGEVILRLGNHDVELALPEVQAIVRSALGQPPAIAARLAFQLGDMPAILAIGGARILVTHGEHDDPWNRVEYARLTAAEGYRYAAGSALVKQIMNPLTREHGLRFVSLLKPDFHGGALAALGVSPASAKMAFQRASIDIAWQLFRNAGAAHAFADAEEDLGLADRLVTAALDPEETSALEAALGDGPSSFSEADEGEGKGALARARLKLARAGLALYARLHRRVSGPEGDVYFDLTPDAAEWHEAARLAAKYAASAVILGHTHAARWREESGLVFANTGTWTWLMQLPPFDAGLEVWAAFLAELQQNPTLAPDKQRLARTIARFTAVLAEPVAGSGASLSLVAWDGSALRVLSAARVPAASPT